jgi:hypothetical protein
VRCSKNSIADGGLGKPHRAPSSKPRSRLSRRLRVCGIAAGNGVPYRAPPANCC